jgi:Flp pilus assembly pilin Flp
MGLVTILTQLHRDRAGSAIIEYAVLSAAVAAAAFIGFGALSSKATELFTSIAAAL